MNFCHLLGLAVILFAGSRVHANESWAISYHEEGRVVVDEYSRGADGWQERVSQRFFTSGEAARTATALRGLSLRDPLNPADGRELRASAGATGLWTASERWSWEWEKRFADWIAAEVDAKFFEKHGLATDCADVLYALRWIFARMHKLEMASRLAGSGDYFTHRSVRASWSSLPTAEDWSQDRRFRAALNYLLDNTFTHSLMTDSYPIKISREAVFEGVYHLDIFRDTGHTQILHRVDTRGQSILPFLIIQSTVPRKVRELSVAGFWYPEQPKPGKGGLLRMRWPAFTSRGVSLAASEKMPFYSLEQYGPDFRRSEKTPYNQEVYLRLNPTLDFRKVMAEAWDSVKAMFRARVAIVEDGYAHCSRVSCAPGTPDEDLWSTPTRDGRITELLQQIDSIRMLLNDHSDQGPLNDPVVTLFGETYSLGMLVQTWRDKRYSSDPNVAPERRWAVSANGVLAWGQEKLKGAVEERARLLAAGKPSGEADSALTGVREALDSYCARAPTSQCRPMWSGLEARNLRVEDRLLTLRALLANIPWMIGRPGESRARQWGEERPTHDWADLFGFAPLAIAGERMLLRTPDQGWSLGRGTPAGLRISKSGTGIAALREDGAFAWSEGSEVLVASSEASTPSRLVLPWLPERLDFSGRRLLARAGDRFVTLSEVSGVWAVESGGTATTLEEPSRSGLWLARDEQGVLRLHDLGGNELRSWALPTSGRVAVAAVVGDQVLLRVDEAIMSLGLAGGSLSALPEFGPQVTCHPAAPLCLSVSSRPGTGTPIRIHRLAADGSFSVEMELAGMYAYTQGDLLTIVPANSAPQSFEWGTGGVRRLSLREDELFVTSREGDAWLLQLKNGSQRLREGARVVLEGKEPMILWGASRVYGYYYSVFDGLGMQGSLRGGNSGSRIIRMGRMDFGTLGGGAREGLLQQGIWMP